ncbi:DUF4238 domain-containing protein [Bradyrhizobium vignae]|uniref:DUF4238 domain-containing protein n=2 Tax=Bradyrhizobium vignae TaxID=1549949 RepID=A0ABS3ZXD1_9BRAD|nr:DUF4238 domain-containing protein [Bradyrhizobium vignae]
MSAGFDAAHESAAVSKPPPASRPRAVVCDFCGHPYLRPCTAETEASCPNMIAKRQAEAGEQQSIRHHYIPQFYSRRWAGDDDRICEFSRPYKKIHRRRVYPKQTGFQDMLYEKKGVPKSIAQQVEDKFMSPVDNFAAKALDIIEADVDKIKNDAEQQSAWSLFLITLMTRMPEDLAALTEILEDDWNRDLPLHKQKYVANRKPDDPETIEEFIEKKDPDHIGRWVMNVAPELMDHEGIGQALNGMRWSVVHTPDDAPPFLSSDRPLYMCKTFSESGCYLTLPIGPHRLFVATNNQETERTFKDRPPKDLVRETNFQVVKQAVKYVYGVDDSEREFIDKLISSDRPPSLLERLRDRRRQKYAPAGKPGEATRSRPSPNAAGTAPETTAR